MTGLFILSLDTEIAWGTAAADLPRYARCFDDYRSILRRLIALLDAYDIPATWAVVAHLFLQPGDERARLPGERPPAWYHGPDVIEAIRAARTAHEIGTHTFTHIYADDPATTVDQWRAQLDMATAIHREYGLTIRSLVYPGNRLAYLDLLPEYGIIAYRGVEQTWYGRDRGPFHLLDRALALPPPTYDLAGLRVNDRLVNLPASQFLLAYDGVRGWIPSAARVRQSRRGLDRAVERDHLFHLWFHPFNLGTSERMFAVLEQILRDVARRRDAGALRVLTMEQAAAKQLAISG